MKKGQKIRVAVLYGGRSAEHEVSLQSAINVIENLDPAQFDIVPIGIDKQGQWFLGHDVLNQSLANKKIPPLLSHHPWFTPEWAVTSAVGTQNEHPVLKKMTNDPSFDVVFPAVHGTLCEDGTLQGLLELAGLPYVGCGVLASAIGMDKDVAKRLVKQADILVSPYLPIKLDQWLNNPVSCLQQIETLGFPVFVKPANTGSSIGINKVKTKDDLTSAINQAFQFDTKILVEQALEIYELEIAVLESLETNGEPIVSVVGEIKSHHEFYSYDAKYVDDKGAELIIPATISNELQQKARAIAKKIFLTLECEGMARIDLFLTKNSNEIYFNEINTIPGFTQISMYPKLMHASGIKYSELLTHLIQLAFKRHKQKSQLNRNYV